MEQVNYQKKTGSQVWDNALWYIEKSMQKNEKNIVIFS